MRAAKRDVRKPGKTSQGFSEAERAAMRERVQEMRQADQTEGESAVLAKIAALPPTDRALAERLHALVKAHAPGLAPKTWYGMPAYAKNGQVVCYFQSAHKFKTRYATLGFSDKANLDDGKLWPVVFAVAELNADVEAKIIALLRRAAAPRG